MHGHVVFKVRHSGPKTLIKPWIGLPWTDVLDVADLIVVVEH